MDNRKFIDQLDIVPSPKGWEVSKKFVFEVSIEVEKTDGKSVPDDELEEAIKDELEDSQPGSIYVDDSEYSVKEYNVKSATLA